MSTITSTILAANTVKNQVRISLFKVFLYYTYYVSVNSITSKLH